MSGHDSHRQNSLSLSTLPHSDVFHVRVHGVHRVVVRMIGENWNEKWEGARRRKEKKKEGITGSVVVDGVVRGSERERLKRGCVHWWSTSPVWSNRFQCCCILDGCVCEASGSISIRALLSLDPFFLHVLSSFPKSSSSSSWLALAAH